LQGLNQATLTYSVDGVPVTKSVQRQTWASENYTGSYAGGFSVRLSGCVPSSLNGIEEEIGLVSVSHVGNSLSLTVSVPGESCSFTGTYTQYGKLGQVVGNYTCTTGINGTFTAYDLTPTISGFTARVQGTNQYCSSWSGHFGGLTRVP
jgi:hypothetical protein